MLRRPRALVALLCTLLISAGCSANLGSTGDRGYAEGDGRVTQLDAGERRLPAEVAGETLDGKEVRLSDFRGKVVVINVWGSWCGPCRSEADDLVEAANELRPAGVVFLGINTRDLSKENAQAFERERKIPYDSLYDPGGRNLLAFSGTLSPNSIPSTVVVDAQGRVAASILGEVTSAATLVGVVEDVSK